MTAWKWDKWQEEVLDYWGDITLRTGRQVGKSEVVAEKAKRFASDNANIVTLVIAASQRQSSFLFGKIQNCFEESAFAEIPTQTKIVLTNGSIIYCFPAGKTGHYIRGLSVDLLICDEAAFVPEIVWNAVLPMVMVSKKKRGFGWIILLSTPFGKGGYYYNSFTDKDFKSWHVSSEDCPRADKKFLAKEKKRMTKHEYAQEYKGEFTESWNQFFNTDLIKNRMCFIEWSMKDKISGSKFYLGIDPARYGGDDIAFVIVEMWGSGKNVRMKVIKTFTTTRVSTTDTIGRVCVFNEEFGFAKIFIDDGGLGGAVTDILIEKFGRKVVGLNNSSKRFVVQGEEKKKGILKEDLYSNSLVLLEQDILELVADLDLARSLKSITFEYTSDKNIKIFGNFSHLAEAMVRACWCFKERGLGIFIY